MPLGLRSTDGVGAPPFTKGPYIWDQQVTFTAGLAGVNTSGGVYYVDGTNGSDGNDGKSWPNAKATIQAAVTAAGGKGTVFVAPKAMAAGATDPGSYEENIIIPATHESLAIIGVSRGRTQGGLPQLKDGAGTTTAILIIRAPGCLIQNFGINGAGNTGGGILLDDDGSTKTAFGTTIAGCHFKNCKGSAAASTGGAIMWESTGGAWQSYITGCHFYNNRADVVLKGTSQSRPQDIIIEDCVFQASANTTVDANLYLSGGSGIDGLTIRNCEFSVVDVPAYASSPDAARYMDLTGCTEGHVAGCRFACTGKTFGAAGNAAKIPTTVRIAECHQEDAIITRT